jgi:repressor of nif and glnA expression
VSDEEILRRLDLLQATLQLAFKPQFDGVRETLRRDPVIAAILDATDDWVGSKELQDQVSESANTSTRTVRDRLPGLVEDRVLEVRGTERRAEYRKTGLI